MSTRSKAKSSVKEKVHLVHKECNYMRAARVKMASIESVKKILEKEDPHILDEKQIQVMKYSGMHTHEKEFVKGKFEVKFERLFDPGPFVEANREANEFLPEGAYKKLEDIFHQFEYTKIHILYGEQGFYSGHALVTFVDDEKKDGIMKEAEEHFEGCLINARKLYL